MSIILEHEILKTLNYHTSLNADVAYAVGTPVVPMFHRNFESAVHFSTLVHILNNPGEYIGKTSVQDIAVTTEMLKGNCKLYSVNEISLAVGILESNGHIEDLFLRTDQFNRPTERKIRLTKNGSIAYRSNFYEKEKIKGWLALGQMRSVIGTNKIQNYTLVMTIIIIGLSCYFQWKTWDVADDALIYQKKQGKEERVRQQLLQLELDDLKMKQAAMYKQIESIEKRIGAKRTQKNPEKNRDFFGH